MAIAERRRRRVRLRSSVLPIETFTALERAGCVHGFVGRVPGIELSHDKAVVLENLDKIHRQAREILGLDNRKFIAARFIWSTEMPGRLGWFIPARKELPWESLGTRSCRYARSLELLPMI